LRPHGEQSPAFENLHFHTHFKHVGGWRHGGVGLTCCGQKRPGRIGSARLDAGLVNCAHQDIGGTHGKSGGYSVWGGDATSQTHPGRLMPTSPCSFAGQATQSAIKEVTIAYEGLCGELNCRPLTAVVLQGLLSPQMEDVNMVNAPSIAKERDIRVSEVRSDEAGAFQTLITLTVTTETQTRSIAGTLFNEEPRMVKIKGIPIDAKLGPNMIYITNEDKPGIIGAVGSILGDAGVNIATFHLGRSAQGGDAIALIEIDGAPEPGLLEKITALPHVVTTVAMKF